MDNSTLTRPPPPQPPCQLSTKQSGLKNRVNDRLREEEEREKKHDETVQAIKTQVERLRALRGIPSKSSRTHSKKSETPAGAAHVDLIFVSFFVSLSIYLFSYLPILTRTARARQPE